jgi:hypothetical protein
MICYRTLSAALAMVLLFTPVCADEPSRSILRGTIYKETVFAVPNFDQDADEIYPRIAILQGPLQVTPDQAYEPKRYEFSQGVGPKDKPYRWRIVHDIYWASASLGGRAMFGPKRLPLEEFPLFDVANKKRKEQYAAKFPQDAVVGDNEWAYFSHYWPVGPVQAACRQYPDPTPRKPGFGSFYETIELPTPGVFFDAYPLGADRILLFVLDRGKMRIWSGKSGKQGVLGWKVNYGDEDKEIESFNSPFKEPFTAFIHDKDYYFVTESGSAYLSCAPGKGERKVEQIWDGKSRPICALITDAAADRVYCFVDPTTKDKPDEERVYFELTAKPERRPYKVKKIEGVKIDDTLKSVLEYAHVLRDDKRLK